MVFALRFFTCHQQHFWSMWLPSQKTKSCKFLGDQLKWREVLLASWMAPKIRLHLRATWWYLFSASYYISIFNNAGRMLPVSKCVCTRDTESILCTVSARRRAFIWVHVWVTPSSLFVRLVMIVMHLLEENGSLFFSLFFQLLYRMWHFDRLGSFEYCPWREPAWHSYLPRRRWHTPITVTSHRLNKCMAAKMKKRELALAKLMCKLLEDTPTQPPLNSYIPDVILKWHTQLKM